MQQIHTFPKCISAMWNAKSLVQELNSCQHVHIQWLYPLHNKMQTVLSRNWTWVNVSIPNGYIHYTTKGKLSCPGIELVSTCPYPMAISITQRRANSLVQELNLCQRVHIQWLYPLHNEGQTVLSWKWLYPLHNQRKTIYLAFIVHFRGFPNRYYLSGLE